MAERRDSLPMDRLLLDIENPRLDQVAADQDDALRRLLAAQRDKILALV